TVATSGQKRFDLVVAEVRVVAVAHLGRHKRHVRRIADEEAHLANVGTGVERCDSFVGHTTILPWGRERAGRRLPSMALNSRPFRSASMGRRFYATNQEGKFVPWYQFTTR